MSLIIPQSNLDSFKTIPYDISTHRKLLKKENRLKFISNLANEVHKNEIRENGLPYLSHLEQVRDFTLEHTNLGYRTLASIIAYSHDIAENSISSQEEISSLRAFYNLFEVLDEPARRRIVNPVGLLTKFSEERMKRDFNLSYFENPESQYFIKTRRIIDTREEANSSRVLGAMPDLQDRILAAIVYLGDLNSNSDRKETLDEQIMYNRYTMERSKIHFKDYLKERKQSFIQKSNRNLLRNLQIMPFLVEFLSRKICIDTSIYNIEKLQESVNMILEESKEKLRERKKIILENIDEKLKKVLLITEKS